MSDFLKISRALVSVADKTGIVDLVRVLRTLNIEIFSTGGTAKLLREHQLQVTEISDITHFPEIMGGRVKTLHPHVYAGILRREQDEKLLKEMDIRSIDLVVVNLYPFAQTINKQHTLSDAIENIDIGGPTLIRAAAKNFNLVSVLTDYEDFPALIAELETTQGQISQATRFKLAQKAFAYTANYEASIANYFGKLNAPNGPLSEYPSTYTQQFEKISELRYGENPHQTAALYRDNFSIKETLASAVINSTQLQGKELSFNNIVDADTAWECVNQFKELPTCVIVKHANPCGIASIANLKEAYLRAYKTDPTSAFGGIIAFNHTVNLETAQTILQQQFVELIVAPCVNAAAKEILQSKPNIRVLTFSNEFTQPTPNDQYDYKRVRGGLLIQTCDALSLTHANLKTVTARQPNKQELQDLLFAWKVVKYVKSNAIVYAKDNATISIGAGQMSRIDSTRIANMKAADAGLSIKDSVMASDAFFPFADSIEAAAENGISAIIQPGGSIRDEEVIAAANKANIAMVFTGIRHFRH